MKKLALCIVCALMMGILLCSCGNGPSSETDSSTPSSNKNVAVEETAYQDVLNALTSDDGEWGYFSGELGSVFEYSGPSLTYYRFIKNGTFNSYTYKPASNNTIKYDGGWEGTYEITDTTIEFTYELTTTSGTETKTRSFYYTFENGVLELQDGIFHKDDWEGIVEDMRERGFYMIDEYHN